MTLYIKNMVCNRCKTAVAIEIKSVGLTERSIELGEVVLYELPTDEQRDLLKSRLEKLGFELLNDPHRQIIERIKTHIIELVHYNTGEKRHENLSDLLVQHLQKDYAGLSSLFSEVEGITIEHFHILQKIERVKELLVYDEMNLSEIAFQTDYSSLSHLSHQFKKITGLTPTHFKKIGNLKRQTLDAVL